MPCSPRQAAGQYLAGDGAGRTRAALADPQRTWTAILSLRQAGLMTVDPPGAPPAVRISPVIQAVIRAAVPDDLYDRAARAAADALLEVWPRDEPRSRLTADLRACAATLRQAAGDVLLADGRCHPLLALAGRSLDSARLTGPAVDWWRALAADCDRVLGSGAPGDPRGDQPPGRGADGGPAGGRRPFRVPAGPRRPGRRARTRPSGSHRGQGRPRPGPGGRRQARARRGRPGGGGDRQRSSSAVPTTSTRWPRGNSTPPRPWPRAGPPRRSARTGTRWPTGSASRARGIPRR